MRDGKDKFYRSLDLPKEEKEVLKWYRNNFQSIKNLDQKKKEVRKDLPR